MEFVLDDRKLYDLEMILNEGFKPLTGFLNKNDYISVINNMRLFNGKLWPIPIIFDVSCPDEINIGDKIILLDNFKNKLAYLIVESIYKPDKIEESLKVFGTKDKSHPGVNYLLNKVKNWYIGGTIYKICDPIHCDFTSLRKSPLEIKEILKDKKNIIGFQTRNPMHKSHYTITKLALEKVENSHLLIHPVIGMTKQGDIDYHTRVKCYQEILTKYDNNVTLSLLPLAMRMAGPREALWHALIRKNYGCTHFIVGRDHAGPGKDKNGENFYKPYECQDLCKKYSKEMGIEILTFNEVGYIQNLGKYIQIDDKCDENILNISGTELRQKLINNENIPDWFTFPEIGNLLKKDLGLTILLTGLSGSGKSTIAYHLKNKLLENKKVVNVLDGDIIRKNISKELGFSKEDRDTNIKRIAYISSLITENCGTTIIPCIAPYSKSRNYIKKLCYGKFIEIYVSTPLEKCEERDVKGLYKKVREGEIKNFTGIDDPYEIPISPDLSIDTSIYTIVETINLIMKYLSDMNLFKKINSSYEN